MKCISESNVRVTPIKFSQKHIYSHSSASYSAIADEKFQSREYFNRTFVWRRSFPLYTMTPTVTQKGMFPHLPFRVHQKQYVQSTMLHFDWARKFRAFRFAYPVMLPGASMYVQSINAAQFTDFLFQLCIEAFCPSLPPFLNAASYALRNDAFSLCRDGQNTTLRINMFQRDQQKDGCTRLIDENYDTSVFDFLLPFVLRQVETKGSWCNGRQLDAKSAALRMRFPSAFIDEMVSEVKEVRNHMRHRQDDNTLQTSLFPLDSTLLTRILMKYVPLVDYYSFDQLVAIVFMFREIAARYSSMARPSSIEKDTADSSMGFLREFNPLLSLSTDFACTMQTSLSARRSMISFQCFSEKVPMWSFSTIRKLREIRKSLYLFIQSSPPHKLNFRFDTRKVILSETQRSILWHQHQRNKKLFQSSFERISFDVNGQLKDSDYYMTCISSKPWRDGQETCYLHSRGNHSVHSFKSKLSERLIEMRPQSTRCLCLILDDFFSLVEEEFVAFTEVANKLRSLWIRRFVGLLVKQKQFTGTDEDVHVIHDYSSKEAFLGYLPYNDLIETCQLLQIDARILEQPISSVEAGLSLLNFHSNSMCSLSKDNDLLELLMSFLHSNRKEGGKMQVVPVRMLIRPPPVLDPARSEHSLRFWQLGETLSPSYVVKSVLKAFLRGKAADSHSTETKGIWLELYFVRRKKDSSLHQTGVEVKTVSSSPPNSFATPSIIFPFYQSFEEGFGNECDAKNETWKRFHTGLCNIPLHHSDQETCPTGSPMEQNMKQALKRKALNSYADFQEFFFDHVGTRPELECGNHFTASLAKEIAIFENTEGTELANLHFHGSGNGGGMRLPPLFMNIWHIANRMTEKGGCSNQSQSILSWLLRPFPSFRFLSNLIDVSIGEDSRKIRNAEYITDKFVKFMYSYLFLNTTIKLACLSALFPAAGITFQTSISDTFRECKRVLSTTTASNVHEFLPKGEGFGPNTTFLLNDDTFFFRKPSRAVTASRSYHLNGLSFDWACRSVLSLGKTKETKEGGNELKSHSSNTAHDVHNRKFFSLNPLSDPLWFHSKVAHSLCTLYFLRHIYDKFAIQGVATARKVHVSLLSATLPGFLQAFLKYFYDGSIRNFLATPYCFCLPLDKETDMVQLLSFAEYTKRTTCALQKKGLVKSGNHSFVSLIETYQPLILHRIVDLLLPPIGLCEFSLLAGAIPLFSSFRILQYVELSKLFSRDFVLRSCAVSQDKPSEGLGSSFYVISRKQWHSCRANGDTLASATPHEELKNSNLLSKHKPLPHPSSIPLTNFETANATKFSYPLNALPILNRLLSLIPNFFVPLRILLQHAPSEVRESLKNLPLLQVIYSTYPTSYFDIVSYKLSTELSSRYSNAQYAIARSGKNLPDTSLTLVLIRRRDNSCETQTLPASSDADAMDKILPYPPVPFSLKAFHQSGKSDRPQVDVANCDEYKNASLNAVILGCLLYTCCFSFHFDTAAGVAHYTALTDLGLRNTGGSVQYLLHHSPFSLRGIATLYSSLVTEQNKLSSSTTVCKRIEHQSAAEAAFDSDHVKPEKLISLSHMCSTEFYLIATVVEYVIAQISIDSLEVFSSATFAFHKAEHQEYFHFGHQAQVSDHSWDVSKKCYGSHITRFAPNIRNIRLHDTSLSHGSALRFAPLIVALRIAFWIEWMSVAAKHAGETEKPIPSPSNKAHNGKARSSFCFACFLMYPGVFPASFLGGRVDVPSEAYCVCSQSTADTGNISPTAKVRMAEIEHGFEANELNISGDFRTVIHDTAKQIADDVARRILGRGLPIEKGSSNQLSHATSTVAQSVFSCKLKKFFQDIRSTCAVKKDVNILLKHDLSRNETEYTPNKRLKNAIHMSMKRLMTELSKYDVPTVEHNRDGSLERKRTTHLSEASQMKTEKQPLTEEKPQENAPASKSKFSSARVSTVHVSQPKEETSNPSDNRPKKVPIYSRLQRVSVVAVGKKGETNTKLECQPSIQTNVVDSATPQRTPSNANPDLSPRKPGIVNTFADRAKKPIGRRDPNLKMSDRTSRSSPKATRNAKSYISAKVPTAKPRETLPEMHKYVFHSGCLAADQNFTAVRLSFLQWIIKNLRSIEEATRISVSRQSFPVNGIRTKAPFVTIRLFVDAPNAQKPFGQSSFADYAVFVSVTTLIRGLFETYSDFLKKYYCGSMEYFVRCHARLFVLVGDSAFKLQSDGRIPWYSIGTDASLNENALWVSLSPSKLRNGQVLNLDYFYYVLQTFLPTAAAIPLSMIMPLFQGISERQFLYFFRSQKVLKDLFFRIETGITKNKALQTGGQSPSEEYDTLIRRSITSLPPFMGYQNALDRLPSALSIRKQAQSALVENPKLPQVKAIMEIPNALLVSRAAMTAAFQMLDVILSHVPDYLTPLSEVLAALQTVNTVSSSGFALSAYIRHNDLGMRAPSMDAFYQSYHSCAKSSEMNEDTPLTRSNAHLFSTDYYWKQLTTMGVMRLANLMAYFDDTEYENANIPSLHVLQMQYYPCRMDRSGQLMHTDKPACDFFVGKRHRIHENAGLDHSDSHYLPVHYYGYSTLPVRIAEIATCMGHITWSEKAPTSTAYDASQYHSVGKMLDVLPECLRMWMLHDCFISPDRVFDLFPLLFEPQIGGMPPVEQSVNPLYATTRYRSRIADHLSPQEMKELFLSLNTFRSSCEDEMKSTENFSISSHRFCSGTSPLGYEDGEEPDESSEAPLMVDFHSSADYCLAPISTQSASDFAKVAVPSYCRHFDKVCGLADLHRNFVECRHASDRSVFLSFADYYWQPGHRINAPSTFDAYFDKWVVTEKDRAHASTEGSSLKKDELSAPSAFVPCTISAFIQGMTEVDDLSEWKICSQIANQPRPMFSERIITLKSGHDIQTDVIEHSTKLKIITWLYRVLCSIAGVAPGKPIQTKQVTQDDIHLQTTFPTTLSFIRKRHFLQTDLAVYLKRHHRYRGDLATFVQDHPAFFYYKKDAMEVSPIIPRLNDARYIDILFDEIIPPCGWVSRRFVNELFFPVLKPAEMTTWMETNPAWSDRLSIENQCESDFQSRDQTSAFEFLLLDSARRPVKENTDKGKSLNQSGAADPSKQWISRTAWRYRQKVFLPKAENIATKIKSEERVSSETATTLDITPLESNIVSPSRNQKGKMVCFQSCCALFIRLLPVIDVFFQALPRYFIPVQALKAFLSSEHRMLIERIGFYEFVRSVIAASLGVSSIEELIEAKRVYVYTGAEFAEVTFIRRSSSPAALCLPHSTATYPGFDEFAHHVVVLSLHMHEVFGPQWVNYATLLASLPHAMREWLGYSCPFTLPALCRLFPRLIECTVWDASGRLDTNHADASPIMWFRPCFLQYFDSLEDAIADSSLSQMHMKVTSTADPQSINALFYRETQMPMFPYKVPISLQSSSAEVGLGTYEFSSHPPFRPPVMEFSSYFKSFIGNDAVYDRISSYLTHEKADRLCTEWRNYYCSSDTNRPDSRMTPVSYWNHSLGRAKEVTDCLGVFKKQHRRTMAGGEATMKHAEYQVMQQKLESSLMEYDDDDDFDEPSKEESDDDIDSPLLATHFEANERLLFFDELLTIRPLIAMS
ncbi:hypothetical protein XU18_4362 [Perkinsela sp. CCAP 1560/4]|nr:hypothetical protein XU18_4362 [Perkinsela sp. CCAP 1560/4]|eukprot:KNH04395.1 hypothetical protein XU18_4362 [Perkinsela sp. CCAP 1560/4]